MDPLINALRDPDEDVRENAAEALKKVNDPMAKHALKAYREDLDNHSKQ